MYNINVLQQTACLVVNPIMVGNFVFLFIVCSRAHSGFIVGFFYFGIQWYTVPKL